MLLGSCCLWACAVGADTADAGVDAGVAWRPAGGHAAVTDGGGGLQEVRASAAVAYQDPVGRP